MRRARLALLLVLVATLAAVLAAPAVAAPLPQATDTPTPTVTATPSGVRVVALDSGNEVVIEHRATDGEKAIFLALVVLVASLWLQWLYAEIQKVMG